MKPSATSQQSIESGVKDTENIIILHDGLLDIATGRSRKETSWKNRQIIWSGLVKKFSVTHRTAETHSEYLASDRARQAEIKDIGGFVGGHLAGGRRKANRVTSRHLLSLDKDFGNANIWEDFTLLYGCAAASYSTHKHSPDAPRQRLIIPLSRTVSPDEYMAIARRIAGVLGIDQFDPTTFQPERLMYWPSTSKDADFFFKYQDGPWLDPDEMLATYRDWRDSSEWPVCTKEDEVIIRGIKKQGEPLEKPGVVGAFCRTYTIDEAIDTFLSEVYAPCDVPDRYTYLQGSTSGGLVVYDNKFAYSHHGTDPVSGKLCNAFDLVRLHKFGLKDEDAKADTPSNKLPSYLAMKEWAREELPEVRKEIINNDFGDDREEGEDSDDSWKAELEIDQKDKVRNTVDNIVIILENDPGLKGCLAYNEFEQRESIIKPLPWKQQEKDSGYFTDTDLSNLVRFLEKRYGLASSPKIEHALRVVFSRHPYHPVRDYLEGLSWDGEERVDTLLINYLGAADNAYVRVVTRKTLVAAVTRVFHPGVKFDNVLTLVGRQGIGKSYLINKLGRGWSTDTFSLHMLATKEGYEQIRSVWLVEIGEMAGMPRADVERLKGFISAQEDRYRVAYGKRSENFPRQCVFFGTTNNTDFLRDPTGNRRFWPVDVTAEACTKDVFSDLTDHEIDQIWAETVQLYRDGETLYLDQELRAYAEKVQEAHSVDSGHRGLIEDYLNRLLPTNWDELDISKRWEFLTGVDELGGVGTVQRTKVCVAEIWCELYRKPKGDMNVNNTKEIHDIMRKLPGWREARSNRKFSLYGLQRAYERTGAEINTPSEKINTVRQPDKHGRPPAINAVNTK